MAPAAVPAHVRLESVSANWLRFARLRGACGTGSRAGPRPPGVRVGKLASFCTIEGCLWHRQPYQPLPEPVRPETGFVLPRPLMDALHHKSFTANQLRIVWLWTDWLCFARVLSAGTSRTQKSKSVSSDSKTASGISVTLRDLSTGEYGRMIFRPYRRYPPKLWLPIYHPLFRLSVIIQTNNFLVKQNSRFTCRHRS